MDEGKVGLGGGILAKKGVLHMCRNGQVHYLFEYCYYYCVCSILYASFPTTSPIMAEGEASRWRLCGSDNSLEGTGITAEKKPQKTILTCV